eukprot:g78146.t1
MFLHNCVLFVLRSFYSFPMLCIRRAGNVGPRLTQGHYVAPRSLPTLRDTETSTTTTASLTASRQMTTKGSFVNDEELRLKISQLQKTWQHVLERADMGTLEPSKLENLQTLWAEWMEVAAEAAEILGQQKPEQTVFPLMSSKETSAAH